MTTTFAAVVFAFVGIFLGVAAIGVLLTDRSDKDRRRSVGRLRNLSDGTSRESAPSGSENPLLAAVGRLGSLVVARERQWFTGLSTQLKYAGFNHPSAPMYFLGARLLFIVIAVAATAVSIRFGARTTWSQAVLWASASGAVGYLTPSAYLNSRIKKRRRVLKHALTDAVDIMVMCTETGASLNAAINWVTEEIQAVHPLLGSEFILIQREMHLGRTAAEAFRTFADRTGVDDVRDLAAVLTQSERYGASIAKALRSYAESSRQERQLWAEEMAQKASVKIVFPMLLCIFPAMFIVILGPAAVQMSQLFKR